MPESVSKQNPRIKEAEVGIRDIKTITIYPLSVGQQIKTSDMIKDTMNKFFSQKVTDVDYEIISFFVDTLVSNIAKVLGFVTDLTQLKDLGYLNIEELMNDIDNDQLSEIVKIIKEVNFNRLIKNLKGPLENLIMNLSGASPSVLRGPLQESVISTQDTDLNTSTGLDTKKEE